MNKINLVSLLHEYIIFWTPFAAAIIAQISKIFIKQKGKKLKIKDFLKFTYAGMPSGHSALMISLLTITGLTQGINSPIFAACTVFAIVVINDAVRLRRYLGQHGRILNVLVKDLKDDDVLDQRYPKMLENIGHRFSEVLIGSLLGACTALLAYWLF